MCHLLYKLQGCEIDLIYCTKAAMNLPDEMIMKIWSYLKTTEIFYSFVRMNEHFDRSARDPLYTPSVQYTHVVYFEFPRNIFVLFQSYEVTFSKQIHKLESFRYNDYSLTNKYYFYSSSKLRNYQRFWMDYSELFDVLRNYYKNKQSRCIYRESANILGIC